MDNEKLNELFQQESGSGSRISIDAPEHVTQGGTRYLKAPGVAVL